MSRLLRHFVDLRPGEGWRLLRAGATLFTIIAGHTLLETARDGLFLQRLPTSWLALVYGAMAVLALIAVPLGARLVRSAGRHAALVSSLAVSASGTALLYLAPPSPVQAFALYLFVGLIATLVVVQFWLVAGQIFTVAEGKRLLGPLAAAGALGAFAGASLASLLLERVDVRHLLPAAAALFAAAALLARSIPEPTAAASSTAFSPFGEPDRPSNKTGPQAALVRRRAYVRRLALLIALATATLLATDYMFKTAATRHIAPGALPAFFARYNAVVTALSLLIQVGGTGWLVRRTGVLAALTVLPLLLLTGAGGALFFHGAFVAVLIAKGADGVLRHSLHRVSLELLWMPLPEAVREQVKEPIDGFLVRGAQAVAAGGLFALARLGLDTPSALAAVVAGLAAAWLAAAAGLRRPYLDQFRRALTRPTFASAHDLDLDSAEVVIEALASPDARQVRAAIGLLAAHGRGRLIPALVLLHDDEEVLLSALPALAEPGRRDWIPLGQRLLEHRAAVVRIAALRALARTDAPLGAALAIDDAAALRDPALRGHAAFWSAQRRRGASATTVDRCADPSVAAVLEAQGTAAEATRIALLDAIRGDGDASWAGVVLALLRGGGDRVVAAAIAAMARVPDPRFVPLLIERLAVRRDRAAIRAALVRLGAPALDALARAFADPATPPRVHLHLPTSIAAFGNQRAADILVDRIDSRGATGYRVLRALARLARGQTLVPGVPAVSVEALAIDPGRAVAALGRNLSEHLRMLAVDRAIAGLAGGAADAAGNGAAPAPSRDEVESAAILHGLLRDKREQALERAFLLLQVLHPMEDVGGLHLAVSRGDRRERAHALELLDALSRDPRYERAEAAGIRPLLLLIADDLSDQARLERARGLLPPPPKDRREALAHLLADDDPTVIAIANHHASVLRLSGVADIPAPRPWPRAAALVHLGPFSLRGAHV